MGDRIITFILIIPNQKKGVIGKGGCIEKNMKLCLPFYL